MARPPLPSLEEVQYPPKAFRCRVRELRERYHEKLTLEQLAHVCGVTPLTMLRIERGSDLKLSRALTLARFFGVPLEDIWQPARPQVGP